MTCPPRQFPLDPSLFPCPPIRTTEPVVGYRVWQIRDGDLWSVVLNYRWPRFAPMWKDNIDDRGIHALKRREDLVPLFSAYLLGPDFRGVSLPLVAGTVSLWGRVTEMERGYLAEFAYPKQLFVSDEMDPLTVMQLEDNYGVPCEMREEFRRLPRLEVSNPRTPKITYNTLLYLFQMMAPSGGSQRCP